MSFIVFWNSSSLFPVGSSNPQSSLCLHETVGQFTLHPMKSLPLDPWKSLPDVQNNFASCATLYIHSFSEESNAE